MPPATPGPRIGMLDRFVTVSNALVASCLDGAPLADDEKTEILADAGLTWEAVRDVNGRSSILVLGRLWKRVLHATNDPFVGIEVGRVIPGERFGLAVHTARHTKTFRDTLGRFCKYAGLINALIKCDFREELGMARFAMKFHWDLLDLERHAVDITFVAFSKWAERHLGRRFVLREVRLRHSLVEARARYEAIFSVPIVLGAKTNELLFDASALDLEIVESDDELGQFLERHASAELAQMPAIASLPARVRQIVDRELRLGNRVELGAVAKELKMAPRHLQRKLGETSTSFSALLDDARRSLAPALLAEPSANVAQVAFQLGYADQTSFIRAFKKWFGMTPGSYRARTS